MPRFHLMLGAGHVACSYPDLRLLQPIPLLRPTARDDLYLSRAGTRDGNPMFGENALGRIPPAPIDMQRLWCERLSLRPRDELAPLQPAELSHLPRFVRYTTQ